MDDMQDRIDDYLNFGASYVWVVNPRNRRGYVYTREGMKESTDGVLRTAGPVIEVSLAPLFEE
jgi:Uma2 family endonuclease